MNVQLILRHLALLSFGPGTLRCWTLHVHANIVNMLLKMMSRVPRLLASICQPTTPCSEVVLFSAEYTTIEWYTATIKEERSINDLNICSSKGERDYH